MIPVVIDFGLGHLGVGREAAATAYSEPLSPRR